ncbi:MAG TPA: alpha/beta hydrolase [Burkholderiaceae bacterium]|nr:alpha/beta hydrolase [Burkholderiaceae bacterium]
MTAAAHAHPGLAPARPAHADARPAVRRLPPPSDVRERIAAAILRTSLRLTFRPFMGPPFPVGFQRAVVEALSATMPSGRGARVDACQVPTSWGRMHAERVTPLGPRPHRALLYLHGGAFCVCSPRTHRPITKRLARRARAEVLVPHYRRTPEHPFPAQIEDGLAAYRQLLADGYAPHEIAIAGDSAGGTLSLLVCLALARQGLPLPAALVLLSPLTDTRLDAPSFTERRDRDPMLRPGWTRQAADWYAVDESHPLANPMTCDLGVVPPTLVQVGEDEILYDDSVRFADAAARAGVPVELEIVPDRWHVFQLQAGTLRSATEALERQAGFLDRCWAAAGTGAPR